MIPESGFEQALAALEWQVELGATEAVGDHPINRYEVEVAAVKPRPVVAKAMPSPAAPKGPELAIAEAVSVAGQSSDLQALRAGIDAFDHCALKKGARNLVFADGDPVARLMIVGEAPGRDEDIEGLPFVGRAGHLLDKMLAAIGMSRKSEQAETAVYITNVLPWRPPQNRDPEADEIAMLLPFVKRHIELVQPDVLVPMGNTACHALLGKKGITRLRGNWGQAFGKPVLPMFHPAYLLRNPAAKREAWADLLALRAFLGGGDG